jgi:hypothetical protein
MLLFQAIGSDLQQSQRNEQRLLSFYGSGNICCPYPIRGDLFPSFWGLSLAASLWYQCHS